MTLLALEIHHLEFFSEKNFSLTNTMHILSILKNLWIG